MRCHLVRLQLKAFKSVGNDWLQLALSPGLTGVTGHNGAGKSNLLSAVCFALACSPSTLGVAKLADLQCTDADEERATHTISAALTPEGTRAYKINNKNKTGKEVKEFLRERGIALDNACSVIKQAQVTSLADSNSPERVAAVIQDTSGYSRWHEETSLALAELKRTRKALQDISHNVELLEASVREDDTKYGALARLEEIEAELAELGQAMATQLFQRDMALQHQLQDSQQDIGSLEARLQRCSEDQHKLRKALEEQAAEGIDKHQELGLLAVQQRVAGYEEEVSTAAALPH
ncbi:hypothetical protein WJX72_011762 [[Myrmecia] bisecta]|uniref:Structural maintenance of chromosomes protein 5 n=1 Tax=[Myrmecia] bisecta TaxID=41462 RepID=A0AAW1PYR4_9CHLO